MRDSPRARIRILIAAATRIESQLLADGIGRHRYLEITKALSTCAELAEAVVSCSFDVLLVSGHLDENPTKVFDIMRGLRRQQPGAKAVVLLDTCKRQTVVAAFQAGAKGVFCRSESLNALCKCIRSVYAGQVWASSTDLEFVVDALASHPPSRVADTSEVEVLSKREKDVVRCVSAGLSNRDIAEHLKLSEHTVKNYLSNIFEKLGVSSRLELIFKVLSEPTAIPRTDDAPDIASCRNAADRGFPGAQLAMGGLYRDGLGLPKDNIRAYTWFRLAHRTSAQVGAASERAWRALAAKMTPAEISEAERQALAWIASTNEGEKSAGGPALSHSAVLRQQSSVYQEDT
jgi:DNA-binding NarL/FixJ family response regulator